MRKHFTSDVPLEELQYVSTNLLVFLPVFISECLFIGAPVHITSIIRIHFDGISKSQTHQKGRALDGSLRGWTKENIEHMQNFCDDYDDKNEIGAISNKDGIRRLIVFKDDHYHIQVRNYI